MQEPAQFIVGFERFEREFARVHVFTLTRTRTGLDTWCSHYTVMSSHSCDILVLLLTVPNWVPNNHSSYSCLGLTMFLRVLHQVLNYIIPSFTDQTSTLDTILSPSTKKDWKKLDDSDEFVQLHCKFWLQGQLRDKLLNINQDQGPFDEESDVDSDCFTLDLGMPMIFNGWTKVWIRKEFIRIYNLCNDYLETVCNGGRLRSMIITGQPGIGKWFTL